jgi:hypothetical protein
VIVAGRKVEIESVHGRTAPKFCPTEPDGLPFGLVNLMSPFDCHPKQTFPKRDIADGNLG